MGELDGRVAIVTGAGRGVGRGEALHLAELGAAVVVNDVTADAAASVTAEIVAAGGRAVAHTADVADWAQARTLVDAAFDTFGRLDVLVNNAGILRTTDFPDTAPAEWDEVLRVCLTGHSAPAHAAVLAWTRQGGDPDRARRIVNTTSLAGIYGSGGRAAYSAAKAGVLGLTWSLSRELACLGVTVNAVAPRAMTRMTTGNEGFDGTGDLFDPALVAPVVGWLAGAGGRDRTGQVFVVGAGKVWPVPPLAPVGPYDLGSWPPAEPVGTELPAWHWVDETFR
jgi:NAD(P)-dependent dehydrogenase (short-subunit alcohol dehydrogenase family)